MKKNFVWKIFQFSELSVDELYEILHLRCEIFVVEQNAPYLDLDNKDKKAIHLCGYLDQELIAYCRLFKAGDYFEEASIGRVIVSEEWRKCGFGDQLIEKAIELEKTLLSEIKITISAQLYLKSFYEKHGFLSVGDSYLEDGIPHIRMKKE